jgi:hypothetical protein
MWCCGRAHSSRCPCTLQLSLALTFWIEAVSTLPPLPHNIRSDNEGEHKNLFNCDVTIVYWRWIDCFASWPRSLQPIRLGNFE